MTLAVISAEPAALALLVLVGIETLILRRRRHHVLRALHELRRPLQALAFGLERDPVRANRMALTGQLDLAAFALMDLDRALTGRRSVPGVRLMACDSLVEQAALRWQPVVQRSGGEITTKCRAGNAVLLCDPRKLAQAIDNLVANALEHGCEDVTLECWRSGAFVRIAVRDRGLPRTSPTGSRNGLTSRFRFSRRGMGLGIVSRVAKSHGGRFLFQRSPAGSAALIELPLAASDGAAIAA